ncbi:hypothetical protein [Actinomadura opuntiae]|uniref:hypothetical protein n=1 Tax=Actinomadura sp. OS1-43 TaxID=604315 RepID=UPI00255B2D17|nr:hypothetical protein [Actinomadura sp. OS1-43]MDL4816840.1 hypothetical protein [Actinomadura sp. OS1-43]
MSQSRPATSAGGAIALVLVGGAVATGVVTVVAAFASYPSPEMLSFRASTGFYLFNCALCGLVTALGLLLCRPRGPVPPILAAVSALVAFEIGKRIGALVAMMVGLERMPDGMVSAIMKPHFNKYLAYELLAVLIAGGIGALRVAMSGGFGPARQGQGSGGWTGPQPAAGFGQPPMGQPAQPYGQPYGAPGGQPMQPPAPSGQPSFAPPPHGRPFPGSQPPPPSGQPFDAPPPPGGRPPAGP